MEIHDSRLLEFSRESDGSGFALFHACVYRSEGVVFQDAQESGWQNVRLVFEGMRVEGEIVAQDEYAANGGLSVNGSHQNNCFLLPADHGGDIALNLCLPPNFDTITSHASRVSSTFEGDFELEALWDCDGNVTRI